MDPSTSGDGVPKVEIGTSSLEISLKVKFTAFEKRVVQLAESMPKGIPDKIIQNDMPEVGGADRAAAINNLISLGLLDLYKQGNELLYKLKTKSSTDTDNNLKNADNEERVVYDIIKEASNKGIWIKDIRFKSNLNQTQLNKILKVLEGKKLIKTIKSVAANKKKVYMLYELEPDRSVTGGAWYTDQDFETEYVQILNHQCFRYLSERLKKSEELVAKVGPRSARSYALTRVEDVCEFIAKLNISKVALAKEDITCILDTLIYDGKVEQIHKGDVTYYVAVNPFLETPGLARTPCGVCPVMKDCAPNGIINPNSCQYLTLWLSTPAEVPMNSTD